VVDKERKTFRVDCAACISSIISRKVELMRAVAPSAFGAGGRPDLMLVCHETQAARFI